jgi:enoyl-CoA hydratase
MTNVDLKIEGDRATITFRSEKGINILSTAVLKVLHEAVRKVRDNKDVRFTVIRAEGKVFIAGADIKEMQSYGKTEARAYGSLGQTVFSDIEALPSITIAAINGAAMGGGLEIALACDFRVAAREAKLALPEVTLGLIPGWGGIGRSKALVGPAIARRLFLSGAPITAEEGHAANLVDEIVDTPDQLDACVDRICELFGRSAPQAIALAKRAFRDGDDLGAFADCFETAAAREGMAAFIEKRPARWAQKG